MPSDLRVGCFTFSDLTVAPASGYTEYVGSRERIIPMSGEKDIAAVERVAAGLHTTLVAEFHSPMGGVEVRCQWVGEDFNRVALVGPAGGLDILVTSVVGEEGADVRVVVFDFEDRGAGDFADEVHCRELGRVARAVAAIPEVDSVWPDQAWPKTFFASVRPEGADS
mgnify:CR=1 FL=1